MTALQRPAKSKGALRSLGAVYGVLLMLVGAGGVAAHFLESESAPLVLLASFTPLFVAVSAIAFGTLLLTAPKVFAVAAAGVLAVGVGTQLPLYLGDTSSQGGTGPQVRLMQANILFGHADAASLVATIRAEGIDILTVSELTDEAVRRLEVAGLADLLPYSFLRPRGGGGGAGIYSRHPLSDGAAIPGMILENVHATVAMRGAAPTEVYALHPIPPYPGPVTRWSAELSRLREVLDARRSPLIVGGDFNSTLDHGQFRRLLTGDGARPLVDAAEYLGAGIVPTYPAGRRFPAVIAIDRILTRGSQPLSFRRAPIAGSDHHGVIGDIRLSPSV